MQFFNEIARILSVKKKGAAMEEVNFYIGDLPLK